MKKDNVTNILHFYYDSVKRLDFSKKNDKIKA